MIFFDINIYALAIHIFVLGLGASTSNSWALLLIHLILVTISPTEIIELKMTPKKRNSSQGED